MIAARGFDHYYIALIDSRTLRTECLSLPMIRHAISESSRFSIYALVNSFSKINRRRFILALTTRSCFECTVSGCDTEYTVRLHCTNCFGSSWSHILFMYCAGEISSLSSFRNCRPCAALSVEQAISSIHTYHKLAANSLLNETPTVAKQYIDCADSLCNRLMDLLSDEWI